MSANKLKRVLVKVSLPLLVLAAGVGAGSVVISSKPQPASNESAPLLRSVNTVRAVPERVAVTVSSQGTVEPSQQISVIPQVSGVIVWVSENFVNGGEFSAGEVLLRIDDRDYRLALATAEANVAEARQQLETAKAQAEQASADWAMVNRIAPTALALRKPQLEGAKARLLSAEAELERARLQLSRTEIFAPFNAVLTDKQVDFGQYVSAGTQLAQLASSDVMEIRLALPERELQNLSLLQLSSEQGGIPVTLYSMSSVADAVWQAQVVRSEAVLDERTRNMTLVARLSGEQLLAENGSPLILGQFVRASIRGRAFDAVYRLPRTALHNASSVFVVDVDGRLRERDVELLEITDRYIIVASGLEDGAVVSTSPLTSSAEGQQVLALETGVVL